MYKNGVLLGILFVSALVLPPTITRGQEPPAGKATVVFFTPGSHWRGTGSQFKALLAGRADTMSTGIVYDGKERVALLTHSRYVALQIGPGPHTFSASESGKHPNPKEAVSLDLKPGSVSYFAVTATSTNYGAGMFMTLTSHIDSATCAEFLEDHTSNNSNAVEKKRVTDKYLSLVDAAFDPSRCTP